MKEICVSVCAKTVDAFVENIKRAKEFADVIELRFDCLNEIKSETLWSQIKQIRQIFNGKLLATFRPIEQGGRQNLTFAQREEFWIHSHVFEFVDWADLEADFSGKSIDKFWGNAFEKIIKSFHDFKTVPSNLDEIYNQISADSKWLKIAVPANDISDSIAVWKLLERAKSDNKKLIPIVMGEAGKWTRILGLAHGAFMTYASLEAGQETAWGQITARDLMETYRVKELDKETEIYGIVGNPVSHSLSPFMQNAAFKVYNLNSVYIPFEVKNLDEFIVKFLRNETREIDLNFRGFSVTIPHKQAIFKHLDFVDDTAEKIGAVNTVKIEHGKLFGFNTDAEGFIEPLRNYYGDLKGARVAILGAGGAARAAIYALKNEGAEVTVFARNLEKAKNLADEYNFDSQRLTTKHLPLTTFDIVVNATPLGTRGELENKTPLLASQIENVKLIYDLIYNPFETRFIKEAQKANVPTIGGLEMLVAQGMKQFEIWSGKKAPMKEMSAAVLTKLS